MAVFASILRRNAIFGSATIRISGKFLPPEGPYARNLPMLADLKFELSEWAFRSF
jgi:hypothetical protein